MYGIGLANGLALSTFISLCSGALDKPLHEQTAIIGDMTIGGSINAVDNLADLLQVCLDAGAKKVLIPSASTARLGSVPPEVLSKFQLSFYDDPIDAAQKSLFFM